MKKSFSISPRIFSHLGEHLIKNESIALLELVKNSYDACATKCKIEFISDQNGKLVKLVIEDNGFGMDKKIIEDAWLIVGTDNKYNIVKPNICGRIPLGEKGIGRFSVQKLGNRISIICKKKDSKKVALFVDWKELSKAKKVSDFEIELMEHKDQSTSTNKTGVRIEIEDLKVDWSDVKCVKYIVH